MRLEQEPLTLEELKVLVTSTFKILNARKSTRSNIEMQPELYFLSLYIKAMVDGSLRDKIPTKSKEERYQAIKDSFEKTKFSIQEAIAIAFQTSMRNHANTPVEYYCQIKPVPEPVNTNTH